MADRLRLEVRDLRNEVRGMRFDAKTA